MGDYTFRNVPQDIVVSVRFGEMHLGMLRRNGGYPDSPVWANDPLSHWLGTAFTHDGSMDDAVEAVRAMLRTRWPNGPNRKEN